MTDYANFSFLFSIFTAAMLLPSLGINNAYVVNNFTISSHDFDTSKVIVGLSLLLLLLIASFFVEDKLYIYAILSGILGAGFDHVLSKYQAKESFKIYNLLLPIRSVLLLFIMLYVLFYYKSHFIEYFFKAVSIVLSVIVFIYLTKVKILFNHRVFHSLLSLFTASKGFIVFEFSVLILMRLEVWLLTFFVTLGFLQAESIAYYWASFSFVFLLPIISSSLTTVLLPTLKKQSGLDGAKKKLIIIFMMMVFGYISLACFAVDFLYGDKYQQTLIILPFMGVGVFFSFMANLERLSLVSFGKEAKGNKICYCQLLASVLLNSLLIPFIGLYGAVVSFVLVRFISLLGFHFTLKRELNNIM
ncbi:polysaccharide biosynthesis C-terminal domain-containing protein [Pseudoalteromonas sp. BZP1]